ncbi:MAG TPA: amidohydrolase family protein [Vicinamibacterales bacterium]|nr:amidohydrolase family protein [Vicinamibacterales bacterium]
MIRYHAAWVLPIAEPPIRDGWVAVDRGRVVAVGRRGPGDTRSESGVDDVDLGHVALMPGLVNAHTHLELSYMLDDVPPAPDFVTWIRTVVETRREQPDPRAPKILDAVERGIRESIESGTAVVGDISNTLVTFEPLAGSALAGVVFFEILRFNAPDPGAVVEHARQSIEALVPTERVRASLAAHAPYSVAPLVFRAIRQAVDRNPFAPCSVHLSESPAEVEFIKSGTGPWRQFLEDVGAWNPSWVAPAVSPVEYLEANGFLHERVLAVHGVQMTEKDLACLVKRGVTLVTCPRSNGHTGAGAPPIGQFYKSGVRVAVGTDSLASAPDLNVFAELATMRALEPSIPASVLLESATRNGARALGFEADYGTIEAGKRSRLLVVSVTPGVGDVEEYLVSGVRPDQLRWVE